jgi:membrane associated rhomboid family serine protease
MAKVWSLVPVLFFIPLRLPAWLVLGMWFVLQAVFSAGIGVADGGAVAYMAHVLGFAVGVLFALRYRKVPPPRRRTVPAPSPLEPPVMWRKRARGGWR